MSTVSKMLQDVKEQLQFFPEELAEYKLAMEQKKAYDGRLWCDMFKTLAQQLEWLNASLNNTCTAVFRQRVLEAVEETAEVCTLENRRRLWGEEYPQWKIDEDISSYQLQWKECRLRIIEATVAAKRYRLMAQV